MPTSKAMSICGLLLALLLSALLGHVANCPASFVAAPFVALIYTAPLSLILWLALLSGLFLDGLTLSPAMGFLGLEFLITARLLYPYRLYLFKDSMSTLPIMTAAFSLVSLLVGAAVCLFFDLPIPSISLSKLLVRLLADIGIGACIFSLPALLWRQYRLRQRRCSDDA